MQGWPQLLPGPPASSNLAAARSFELLSALWLHTGLQEAARNDHTEVVKLLTQKGGCVYEDDKVRARDDATSVMRERGPCAHSMGHRSAFAHLLGPKTKLQSMLRSRLPWLGNKRDETHAAEPAARELGEVEDERDREHAENDHAGAGVGP